MRRRSSIRKTKGTNIEGLRQRAMASLSTQTRPLTPDTTSMIKTLAFVIGGLLALGWLYVKLRGYVSKKGLGLPGASRLSEKTNLAGT